MIKKYLLWFILGVHFSISSLAQSLKIDTIKTVAPKGRSYTFPKVKISNKKAVANIINTDLCTDFLDIDLKKVRTSIFENVWATNDRATILSDITFDTYNFGNKILSINISAEGCGAYCETYTKYYNYDLQNGKRLSIEKIFSSKGLKVIADSLSSFKKHKIKNKIDEVNILLKNGLKSKSDSTFYEGMLDLYKQCTADDEGINYLKYVNFKMAKGSIIFILERCSAHVNRNVDEIDEFIIPFRIIDLKLYTAYGRKLLHH